MKIPMHVSLFILLYNYIADTYACVIVVLYYNIII